MNGPTLENKQICSTDSLIYNKVTGRGSTSGATQGEHESRATDTIHTRHMTERQ